MIIQWYLFFAIGAFWTSFVWSMLFLFTPAPKVQKLQNYQIAKIMMAIAYLIFCIVSLYEILIRLQGINPHTGKISILIISIFQLYLFTYVNISLIDLRPVSVKKIGLIVIPPTLLSVLNVGSYLNIGQDINSLTGFYSLLFFYIFSVIAASVSLFKHYRIYKQKFANYFISNSKDYLRWVYISNLCILLSSIVIILFAFSPGKIINLYPILVVPFYTGYAMHFLNYSYIFNTIEPIFEEEPEKFVKSQAIPFSHIEEAIIEWEKNRHYLKAEITIATVAAQISTNRTYLSSYLNTYKQKSFSDWINGLRIEEAKRIMRSNEYLYLDEICDQIGYTDKSYFSKCFKKYTGMTTKEWKNSLR